MRAVLDEAARVQHATARQKIVRRFVFGLLVLLSALVGALSGLLLVYSTDLPQVEQLEHYRPVSTTELYDINSVTIGSFALQRRVVASYGDFPRVLIQALISTEDKDFYRHSGINFWRIAGAAYRDIQSGGKVQGASTLTMQLARNLLLSPDRKHCWRFKSSGGSRKSRSSLCMETRFILVMECTGSKPRRNSISTNPRES